MSELLWQTGWSLDRAHVVSIFAAICQPTTYNILLFSHFLICLSKMLNLSTQIFSAIYYLQLTPSPPPSPRRKAPIPSSSIFLFQAPSSIAMNGFVNGYKHCGLRWNYWPYTITHSAITMNVLPLAVNAHKRSILWENNIVDTYIYIAAL